MDPTTVLLEQAATLLADAAAGSFTGVSDDALVGITRVTEQVGRRLDAIRVQTAAELDTRSRRELGDAGLSRRYGYQRASHLIEGVALVSAADAARRIRLGAGITPRTALDGHPLPPLFPQVAAALSAGTIGADAAAHIVRALEEAAPRCAVGDLTAAETALVASATVTAPDLVAGEARVWRDHLDTDGTEPREERQHAARRLTIGRERDDGMTPFTGLADPINAGVLRAAFAAHPVKPEMGEDGTVEERAVEDVVPDGRTFEQRDFDILMGLIRTGTQADPNFSPGGRATVTATVTLADLEAGVGAGWVDDVRDCLPIRTIDQLVCDAGVEIVITGANGALLALTSTQQMFTRRQRRALATRDGGCVWPGCRAPASWADAHHVTERRHGGPTHVSNGTLLCPAHHRMLHTSAYRMKMIRGRPHLLAPPTIDPSQQWRAVGKARHEMLESLQRSRDDESDTAATG